MTDTVITEEVVGSTITALEATLRRALERYDIEEREAAEKRVTMTEVAHRRATANGIGSSLDDLLEEFGLPRRPWRGSLYAALRFTAPVESDAAIRVAGGLSVYREPGVSLSWTQRMESEATLREGDTCLCDAVVDEARTWARNYYGAGLVAPMTMQAALARCTHVNCPSVDNPRPTLRSSANHDWSGVPPFPAVAPEPVASEALIA